MSDQLQAVLGRLSYPYKVQCRHDDYTHLSGDSGMLRTYKAVLHDNQVEWLEQPPEKADAVEVYITVLEEPVPDPPPQRGRLMAEVLAELAVRGTFAEITDPVAWQRELRSERVLLTGSPDAPG